ncbi:MAG TPA: rhodanese-like domain-containing protein [Thermomicrobiales bacterium]|nr:rhodanese-like domain-containing protein [Thermomicrobiales bacterium]
MSTFSRRQILAATGAVIVLGTATARARGSLGATPEPSPVADLHPALVTAKELADLQGASSLVAVMPDDAFAKRRIAGSIQLDWAELELKDTSDEAVAAWTAKMQELVAVRGIRADRPAVVYDEGTLFAARGWWQLAYLGYPPPTILDGGLPAWIDEGEEVESGPEDISPVEAPLLENAIVQRSLLATKADVLAVLDDPDVLLVDARAPEEYAAGHIPGARNVPYTDNAVAESSHVYKPADALRAMYEAAGVAPDKRVITYCSTGVRGSVAHVSLRLAGYQQVALYVGSWNEWGADSTAPKTTGNRP